MDPSGQVDMNALQEQMSSMPLPPHLDPANAGLPAMHPDMPVSMAGLQHLSPAGAAITNISKQFLGVPYKWGGNSMKGLDCSGFIQQVYAQMGINLPRVTTDQYKAGHAVGLKQIQPGDAVFTEPGRGPNSGPGHVGLYIGNGMVQESPHTGTVNSIIPLKDFLGGGLVGIRRYVGPPASPAKRGK
jgi:cell wall-associated NlpC family hydrolase